MKLKRNKAGRKLMQKYRINFGIREPFQVIVDAGLLKEAKRLNMDLVTSLTNTLHGEVKPMITQCLIRHLYNAEPKDEELINCAKTFERRRCDHSISEEELSTLDCLSDVVDNKGNGTNKHHYIIASQDIQVRIHMRSIPGVPLVHISGGVMFLERMASESAIMRTNEENAKLKGGLKEQSVSKRVVSLQEAFDGMGVSGEKENAGQEIQDNALVKTTKDPNRPGKRRKVKGPNPMSVKKPKRGKFAKGGPTAQDQITNFVEAKRKAHTRKTSGATPLTRSREKMADESVGQSSAASLLGQLDNEPIDPGYLKFRQKAMESKARRSSSDIPKHDSSGRIVKNKASRSRKRNPLNLRHMMDSLPKSKNSETDTPAIPRAKKRSRRGPKAKLDRLSVETNADDLGT